MKLALYNIKRLDGQIPKMSFRSTNERCNLCGIKGRVETDDRSQ